MFTSAAFSSSSRKLLRGLPELVEQGEVSENSSRMRRTMLSILR